MTKDKTKIWQGCFSDQLAYQKMINSPVIRELNAKTMKCFMGGFFKNLTVFENIGETGS